MAKITGKGILGLIGGLTVATLAGVSMLKGKDDADEVDAIETDDYEEVEEEAVEDEAE